MISSLPFFLPATPLAIAGIQDGQTQINGLLMLQCCGWLTWLILVMAGDSESFAHRGRTWLMGFLAVKGLAGTLLFTLAQSTAWDRELLQNTVYVGSAALAYGLWGLFMVRQWPTERWPHFFRAAGWLGVLAWLAQCALQGPTEAWRSWPWLVVTPVIAGAWWAAWRERHFSFAALGAALLIEFADPKTVLAWYAGFVSDLSLTWDQIGMLPADAAKPAPGNSLVVIPVGHAALAWFSATVVSVWLGFLNWHPRGGSKRGRFWIMPLAALGLTCIGFLIYGLSLAAAFSSLSRETASRLDTLASVAPWSPTASVEQSAQWDALRRQNSELGEIFRCQITTDGRRLLLDPVVARGAAGLAVLPIERAALARGKMYGFGPIMYAGGASFFSAVPAGRATDGSTLWLAVIGPIERFYVYKRPSALLGNVMIFLFGAVGVITLGYMLHRERVLRQQIALERAEESASVKTSFLAKVSHELRTPLQGLLGYSELLHAEATTDAARTRLAALRQNGELMLRLVNDLLDLTAIEAGGFRFRERSTGLPALVRETGESLRPRAEAKGLALHIEVAADFPPWVACDGERFRQILLNLLGNAVKFTDLGRIEVALRLIERTAPDTCLIELAVRDTGPGISPAEHALLFQPFSRLDLTAPQEGSGLGLALAAALCRQAGGDLTLESDGRNGACFRARLRVRIDGPPPVPPRPADPFPTLSGRRILVVDDNSLVRDLFAAWLADCGAVCESAADGEQALALAQERMFDAVILDLSLPRLDGRAVARRWRAEGRTWRIIGVSAHASDGDRTQALAAGMDAFLSKPVGFAHLAAALAAGVPVRPAPEKHDRLRAELATRFRATAADDAARVTDALTRHDWPALHARAHHLKSSAGVVGDEALYAACTTLEDAAESHDATAAAAAWARCKSALAPWVARDNPQ